MNQKLTITIPVRIDTVERLENISVVVNFLFQNGFQNISVIEGAPLLTVLLKNFWQKESITPL